MKVAIRMGPPGTCCSLGGRLGWLKWREFGRRGDTARDQVIRVLSELLSVAPCLPVGTTDSKAGPPSVLPLGAAEEGDT